MPRPNQSLPQREREICDRVAYIRKEIAKWSQPDLTKAAGITHHQLAGIEYKRSPLRYSIAIFLCHHFNVSQRWLALGVLPIQPRYDIRMDYSVMVKPNSLFSEVFDGWLDEGTKRIELAWIKELGEGKFRSGNFNELNLQVLQMPERAYANGAMRSAISLVGQMSSWLPDDLKLFYSDCIFNADRAFRSKYAKQIASVLPPSERDEFQKSCNSAKSDLTNASTFGSIATVKELWPALKKRLQSATAETGKKSELAEFLGVDLTMVSRWLADKKSAREPGAEYTLQLLHWVEQQERQK